MELELPNLKHTNEEKLAIYKGLVHGELFEVWSASMTIQSSHTLAPSLIGLVVLV
jgi:hypothetical protein